MSRAAAPPVADGRRDAIENALREHRPYVTQGHRSAVASLRIPATIDGCQCGAPGYFAHLAAVLAALPDRRGELADVEVEAYRRGYDQGHDDCGSTHTVAALPAQLAVDSE